MFSNLKETKEGHRDSTVGSLLPLDRTTNQGSTPGTTRVSRSDPSAQN